jgi:hypothetical protein
MKSLIKKLLKEAVNERIRFEEYKTWVRTNVITRTNQITLSHSEDLDENIQEILGGVYIGQSLCFDNAQRVLKTLQTTAPDIKVEVVLGMIGVKKQFCGHAWNKVNGIHIDLTAETFVNDTFHYFPAAYFNNSEEFGRQGVFHTSEECEAETFDLNGNCSIYPYFIDNL